MKKITMIASLSALIGSANFNAHAGWKLYISTTAQNADVADAAAYDLLTWTEITGVGSVGETGTTQNILTYDTWDTSVAQKAKGIKNAGDPEVELARDGTDAGQIALRAAALTNDSYGFKIEANDSGGTNPTTFYNRGLVTGPRNPHGRNEDFDIEVYQLAFQQLQIVKEAA